MVRLRRVLICLVLASLVSACGARGPLEPPPNAEAQDANPPFVLDGLI